MIRHTRLAILTLIISISFFAVQAGAAKKRTVSINFKDMEIKEFVSIMSRVIGKNIILDDKVNGKITISSPKRIPIDQVYDVMKSILELKGLAVIESKNLIKVVPINDAVKKNVEIIVDDGQKVNLNQDKTITFLMELKHAEANQVGRALISLKSKFTNVVIYRDLNMIILSGNAQEIDGLIKVAKALDKPSSETQVEGKYISSGNIHVIHLQNSDATNLANVLSRVPFSETAIVDSAGPPGAQIRTNTKTKTVVSPNQKSKLSIIANKETNSLIITATPEEFSQIKAIIDKLDIVRQQVLIEALIIEISAENAWSFGIDWYGGYKVGSNVYGGSQILGTAPSFENNSGLSKTLTVPLATGFQLGFLNDSAVLGFALLNAAASDDNFNVLSTPQILTEDNQEAELNVAEDIPIPTSSSSDSGTESLSFTYKSVGIKLKITPHITDGNRVTMDVYQEINSVLGETTVLDKTYIPPTLGKRDIKTRITVIDGKTVVIGGLIKNNKTETVKKVPILGDIPLLGWFFKRKTEEYKKSNLLIFITPRIVTDPKKLEQITNQKKEEQNMLGHDK